MVPGCSTQKRVSKDTFQVLTPFIEMTSSTITPNPRNVAIKDWTTGNVQDVQNGEQEEGKFVFLLSDSDLPSHFQCSVKARRGGTARGSKLRAATFPSVFVS